VSITFLKSIAFASAAALVAPGTAVAADQAAVPVAATQAIALPTAGSVAAIYNQYKMKPIWFRNGAPTVAATQLVQILRRSPLDGLGSGPQLADQIEAFADNTMTYLREHIDLGRDHSAWMARLKCTSEELSAAVGVVGPQALAVQIFIRGARTGGRTTATRGRRRRP